MPRGYRRYVIAAFGWLILAAAPLPPNKGTEADKPKPAQTTQKPAPPITQPVKPKPVEKVKPSEYERPCKPGQYNYNSDLCAQWTAAQGAAEAALWAKYQFWLGIVGTIALLWTLRLTRKATRAATRSVDAQIAAARPIMSLSKVDCLADEMSTDDVASIKFGWTLKNYGQTGCWVESLSIICGEIDSGDTKYAHSRLSAFVPPGTTVQSKIETTDHRVIFTIEETIRLRNNKRFQVWGNSVYRNSEKLRWQTGFALWVEVDENLRFVNSGPVGEDKHWSDALLPEQRRPWRQRIKNR